MKSQIAAAKAISTTKVDQKTGIGRWGLYIDVEGFSSAYDSEKSRALFALTELMEALYKVGSSGFLKSKGRTFIHQFGDGFVAVSEFPEETSERPLAICLGVMRHLIARGVATKAGISRGDFADIFSLYPQVVQEAAEDHRLVPLGDNGDQGLMTIIPLMGSALTKSYGILRRRHGAVLLLDTAAFCGLPPEIIRRTETPALVDWVHSELILVRELCKLSGLKYVDSPQVEKSLLSYLEHNHARLSEDWRKSTLNSVGL